jgi:nickel-dependent lactate racemase
MIYFEKGAADEIISNEDLKEGLNIALQKIGDRKKILIVPPDFTRFHSKAGEISSWIYQCLGDKISDILPALGTHTAMTQQEINTMFPGIPHHLFRVHNWRNDVVTVGAVSAKKVSELSHGAVNAEWPVQINKLLWEGNHDLILSIGQVVPHEVIGMANYNKNILVGIGGSEGINKSHFVGAVHGMEKVMGRADNPVRQLLNYASEQFLNHLPIVYVQTVISRDKETNQLVMRGLFIGDDISVFTKAAQLSLQVNFTMLDKPISKAVVYLDPSEFKSTWLGNKSIYRTRMAMADQGELIILAPGLKEFGEDQEIDRLIRKYGYRGTTHTLKMVKENAELENNLGAAAHLIHGSSEGRFNITYCPGILSKEEIESVNFNYAPLSTMLDKYRPEQLKEGYNTLPNGEEIYFISNPAIGLWAYKERFKND